MKVLRRCARSHNGSPKEAGTFLERCGSGRLEVAVSNFAKEWIYTEQALKQERAAFFRLTPCATLLCFPSFTPPPQRTHTHIFVTGGAVCAGTSRSWYVCSAHGRVDEQRTRILRLVGHTIQVGQASCDGGAWGSSNCHFSCRTGKQQVPLLLSCASKFKQISFAWGIPTFITNTAVRANAHFVGGIAAQVVNLYWEAHGARRRKFLCLEHYNLF